MNKVVVTIEYEPIEGSNDLQIKWSHEGGDKLSDGELVALIMATAESMAEKWNVPIQ